MKYRDDNFYIKKILSGDPSYYAFLVDKYKDMTYNIALKICRNREDAEEIAQDTFVKIYNGLKDFRKDSKFSTWLYKIVYNTAISKMRKKKVETEEINIEYGGKVPIIETNMVIESLRNEDQKKYISIAMESLSEIDNLILTLFYYDDRKIEEISKITDISPGNVKIKLFRARKKLYVELDKILSSELKAII